MNFIAASPTPDWDRSGLPAWTYHSKALLELEVDVLFRRHWQLAGHVSDLPNAGDFLTLDIADDRALIVRGEDGVVRGFHNLCRHRGSRVATEPRGQCKRGFVCPFHGWVYNIDGTLRGPAQPQSFGAMDRSRFGLKPLELDIFMGFIFIRFLPGSQPPVSELFAAFAPELANYRMDDLIPAGPASELRLPVNWKSVRDVDNEGYHVAMAHPALHDLYGANYRDQPYVDGVSRSLGRFGRKGARLWSVRHYQALTGGPSWLDPGLRQVWGYYGMFPNAVIAVTPELVQFYQEFPAGVQSTVIRGAIYRRPVESRQERLARYLASRIDRATSKEDTQLSIWSNESMKSCGFDGFHLSDLERTVRSHHDQLRLQLPIMALPLAPPETDIAALNAGLLADRQPATPA
ncbi:aromatic ring-hydroxylating dioxygenase subunit alpha [Aestuariivirga sp.]|jgi:phenylpropionate dioxygenase-like ring-hydroxylating dioxygenase large terminal subunit|uniref:aromatic ring-hydroxylating dioxygenase subunit alpha n=1 Tax=Aestuariivirga sp. TaxID=2650926 RepID=UPI003784D980